MSRLRAAALSLDGGCPTLSFPHIHPQAQLGLSLQLCQGTDAPPADAPALRCEPSRLRWSHEHASSSSTALFVHLPLHQTCWLGLDPTWLAGRQAYYPFAIKAAAQTPDHPRPRCALTGGRFHEALAPQASFLVAPLQPWLDAWRDHDGRLRPLSSPLTLHLWICPLRGPLFERYIAALPPPRPGHASCRLPAAASRHQDDLSRRLHNPRAWAADHAARLTITLGVPATTP